MLTERENQVLRLLAVGMSNREIGGRLVISEATVKFHVRNLRDKLDVRRRTEIVYTATRQGIVVRLSARRSGSGAARQRGWRVELLPAVLASGWASGVNAYLCVLVLGLLGRFAGVEAVPEALTRTDVLVVAALLYALEFVADKIPYLDSAWDAISTAIRPTAGVVIGLLIAGDSSTTLEQAVLAATGGGAALASHLVKGGLRLIVNTSPEPVTNIGVSLGEDVAVAGVTSLAVLAPDHRRRHRRRAAGPRHRAAGRCCGAGSAAAGGGCGNGGPGAPRSVERARRNRAAP